MPEPIMNKSDTPETDAAEFPVMTWPERDNPMVVRSTLARSLERQRDSAIMAAEKAKSYKRVLKTENARLRRLLEAGKIHPALSEPEFHPLKIL